MDEALTIRPNFIDLKNIETWFKPLKLKGPKSSFFQIIEIKMQLNQKFDKGREGELKQIYIFFSILLYENFTWDL